MWHLLSCLSKTCANILCPKRCSNRRDWRETEMATWCEMRLEKWAVAPLCRILQTTLWLFVFIRGPQRALNHMIIFAFWKNYSGGLWNKDLQVMTKRFRNHTRRGMANLCHTYHNSLFSYPKQTALVNYSSGSQSGSQIGSISITRELGRNANDQTSHQAACIGDSRGGRQQSVF